MKQLPPPEKIHKVLQLHVLCMFTLTMTVCIKLQTILFLLKSQIVLLRPINPLNITRICQLAILKFWKSLLQGADNAVMTFRSKHSLELLCIQVEIIAINFHLANVLLTKLFNLESKQIISEPKIFREASRGNY